MSYIFGKGSKGGKLANFYSPPKPKTLSVTDQLRMQAAKKQGHSKSFWDNIKGAGSATLHPVEWTLDKIMRPAYGLAAGIAEEHRYQNTHPGKHWLGELEAGAKGFARGFTGKEKHGFGAALPFTHDTPEHHTFLKGHRFVRGAIGFGADVVFDPVTYVSGGTTILARSGEHAFAIAAGRRALTNAPERYIMGKAVTESDHAAHLAEAAAKTQKDITNLGKMGKDYRYRLALAKANMREIKAAQIGKRLSENYAGRKRVIAAAARAEEKRVEKFVPHYAIKKLKLTPSIAGKGEEIGGIAYKQGRQLVPALPKLDHFIEKGVPGSSAAMKFREAFIRPASETPETYAMAHTTMHVAERITSKHFRDAQYAMHGIAEHIKPERQREILHHFEMPPKGEQAVIKAGERYVVNPRYAQKLVKSGKITEQEAEFATRYQSVMEDLFLSEKAHGAVTKHFSQGGRMYVPHLMDNAGNPANDAMKLLTSKAGFEYSRQADRHLSLKQLVDLSEKGKLDKGVVTDPFHLMVSRIRASGRRQAELNQLDAMGMIGGVRTRLVDKAKLDNARIGVIDKQQQIAAKEAEHTQALTEALTAHEQAVAASSKKLNSIKYGRKSRTKAATLARLSKKHDRLVASGPNVVEASARHAELKALNKELKTLQQAEKDALKGRKNPEFKKSMFRSTDLRDEYGHKVALPDELGQAATKVRRVIEGDDQAIKSFEAGYRKLLAKWKLMVTSINPGYRMRNSQTDLWNWWLKPGVNTYYISKNLGKATKYLITMKNFERKLAESGGKLTPEMRKALKQSIDMYDHGILSGLYQGDIQVASEMLRIGQSKKALLKQAKLLSFGEKVAQDMNRNGENWVRIAHYMWATEDKKLSPVLAADSVKSAHFDYEALTPFEKRRMKAIAPFYTWTRKNIPYQIKALFTSPGKYAALGKAAMEAQTAAGTKKGDIIPSFVSQGWGIPIGHGNYVMPQLGASDLQVFDNGKKGVISRAESLATPFGKLPVELATNHNLFTGGQIASDTHSRNPTTPLGEALLHLLPGGDPGQTSRVGPGGRRLYGPGGNPYWLHALGYLGPTSNILLKKSGGIGRAQMGPVSPLWSYLGGVTVTHVDQAQERMMNNIQLSDEAKKMLQSMRDEGLIPQSKRKKTKRQRAIEAQINAQIGR